MVVIIWGDYFHWKGLLFIGYLELKEGDLLEFLDFDVVRFLIYISLYIFVMLKRVEN